MRKTEDGITNSLQQTGAWAVVEFLGHIRSCNSSRGDKVSDVAAAITFTAVFYQPIIAT